MTAWFRSLRFALFSRRRVLPRKRMERYRPTLEQLEDRCVPSAITDFPGPTAGSHSQVAVEFVSGNTATSKATLDAPLTGGSVNINATAGVSFSGMVARFADADPNAVQTDYSVAINWGDGTPIDSVSGTVIPLPRPRNSQTIGEDSQIGLVPFQVNGTHTYATAGTFAVNVTVTDTNTTTSPGGSTATTTSPAIVSAPPASLAPLAPPPSVSVAMTPFGEVLAVVSANGTLTQFDAAGAHTLGGGVRSASVAFGKNGEILDVVYQNGSLVQFDATGFHALGSGVLDAGVAFGPFGEVLDVVSTNGVLTQYDAAGAHTLGGVRSVSVSFGPFGEVLDVVSTNGALTQFDAAGAHSLTSGVLSAGATFGNNGEILDAIFANGSLVQFDAFGVHVLGKLF